jgi:hypothetical protein
MGADGGINSDNIRAKIRKAYYKNNKVADDDALLLNEVWKASGWDNSKTLLQNLRTMPSPETIRRTRQKLVAEGLIKPSMSAIDRRYASWKKTRKGLSYE